MMLSIFSHAHLLPVFFGEVSAIQQFCPFLVGLLMFLFLSLESSLYSLDNLYWVSLLDSDLSSHSLKPPYFLSLRYLVH